MDAPNQNAMERPARTSISEAAVDVFEAGQQLFVDRIDLIRNDALQVVARLQQQAVLIVAAAVLLATAWVAFNCAATAILAQRFTWTIAGTLVGSVNALIGLVLIAWAARRSS